MAYIVPDSVITLYNNVPITNQEQIAFKTLAQQTAYFATKIFRSKVNCSYVRRNGRLKIEDGMGLMLNCNYISFRNPSFENKTIYARVIDYEYINNTTVEIQYVIDWFQTFMFDVTYEDAVMDREHLSIADWNKVEANPYDRSVYEMFTPEPLPVTKEMEKLYVIPSDGSNELLPNTPLSSQDYAYTQLFTGNPDKAVCMLISDFDYSELQLSDLTDFWSNFDYIYTSGDFEGQKSTATGKFELNPTTHRIMPAPVSSTDSSIHYINSAVPHAYNICFMQYSENNTDKLQNVIDYMTLQGVTHCIIGIYMMSSDFSTYLEASSGSGFNYKVHPVDQNVVNKKLLHSPYQYIRVETASGDSKEYYYEYFLSRDSGNNVSFRYIATVNGTPCVMLIPYQYKTASSVSGSGTIFDLFGFDRKVGFNIDERIEFNAFPQIGYVTDAYLTYLSGQYTQNLQNRTINSEQNTTLDYYAKQAGDFLGGVAKGAGQIGTGNYIGAAITAEQTMTGMMGNKAQMDAFREASVLRNLSGNDAQEIATGDAISMAFKDAKAGFIADEYHPSNANGANLYYSEYGNIESFKVTRVQLRDVFVQKYDAYFTHYGYSSSRIGVPRICNFMANSSNNAELPKFLTQTNGYSMTYVKTQSMNVNATMKPVSDFIEQMFNNGMRFIDGSTL